LFFILFTLILVSADKTTSDAFLVVLGRQTYSQSKNYDTPNIEEISDVIAHLSGVIPTHFPTISPLVEQVGKQKSLFSKINANILFYFDDIGQDLITLHINRLPYLKSMINSNGKIAVSKSIQGAEVTLFSILNGVSPRNDASDASNIISSIVRQKLSSTNLFSSTSFDYNVASLASPTEHTGDVFFMFI